MKKYMLMACLIAGTSVGFAQKKAVSEAMSLAVQEKPDFTTAESKIKEALQNEETKNDVKTWYTAGSISIKHYEAERNKKILKQKVDEKAMYSALYDGYNYWTKCLELDKLPDAKGKVKPKYDKEIVAKIKESVNDFINGGAYFYDQKDYQTAYKYFSTYAKVPENENLKELNLAADQNYKQIPYYASLAAMNSGDNQLAVEALNFAKKVDYQRYNIYYFITDVYKKSGQKDKYLQALKEGYEAYSDSMFFLGNLVNEYINNKDYEKAITFLKEGLKRKQDLNLYIALGEVLQAASKPEQEVKETFEAALKVDPNYAQAHYYLGRLKFNKAVEMNEAASKIPMKEVKKYNAAKEQVKATFREALPYFKKALELKPNNLEYMTPIRNIYYQLNMTKEYDAIDKQIKALQ
jgi:Uncharacterized enzyme of heme biosynthesis